MSGTVLITGASGFIGSHLWRRLLARGDRVVAITSPGAASPAGPGLPLRLPAPELPAILARERPAIVVHCAGGSSVSASFAEPARDFHDNVVVTEHLLRAVAATLPRPTVVFISSAAIYGQPAQLPVPESAPAAPLSPYGFHKLMAELVLRRYQLLDGVKVQVLRLFSVYGPGLRKQVLWEISRQALKGDRVVLCGSGDQRRDFMEIDDAVSAVELAIERGPGEAGLLNVASGHDVALRDVAALMLRALGREVRVEFSDEPRPGDPPCWRADVSRIRSLGLGTGRSLEDGLRRYAEWVAGQP